MRERHAGWVGAYLEHMSQNNQEYIIHKDGANRYNGIPGIGNILPRVLLHLNETTQCCGYARIRLQNRMFLEPHAQIIKAIYGEHTNASTLKYLHLVKLLALRSFRAQRMAHVRPAHGQSGWHNAHTVRYANTFLYAMYKQYSYDLFFITTQPELRYTKLHAMREMARTRRKKAHKKFTKFKRFGERRLALKRKKSLWR